jgi:hypothetical protein
LLLLLGHLLLLRHLLLLLWRLHCPVPCLLLLNLRLHLLLWLLLLLLLQLHLLGLSGRLGWCTLLLLLPLLLALCGVVHGQYVQKVFEAWVVAH